MNPMLIAIAVAAALGFGGAWTVQGAKINRIKLEHANDQLTQQLDTFKALERNQRAVVQAQDDASRRVATLKRDADRVRSERDGLLNSIEVAMRAAAASHDACNRVVDAYGVIFAQSSGFIQVVANDVDQCFSDQKLMQDAWPK